jgi:hypothetical protein
MAAIGLGADENDDKDGRERRKLETNMVRAEEKLRRGVCQLHVLISASEGWSLCGEANR